MSYTNLTDATALGFGSAATASYQVRIGDSYVTSIGGYANWSNISDARVKKNVQQNVPGLAFINQLQPVTYNFDLDAKDKIVQMPLHKDKDGKPIPPSPQDIAARAAKEKITYTGFVAQDVEKAAKSLNFDFRGVDAPKKAHDMYGLRYAEFVVPLTKAVQELSAQNDSLKNIVQPLQASVTAQEQEINDLKKTVAQLEVQLQAAIKKP